MKVDSNISAPTWFVPVGNERYAFRRFGKGSGLPLFFLQHFTGTLDSLLRKQLWMSIVTKRSRQRADHIRALKQTGATIRGANARS
jgi:hypothetical protein